MLCASTERADREVACARQVTDAIQAAADAIGATSVRMISRGYHDAGLMAQARTMPVLTACLADSRSASP